MTKEQQTNLIAAVAGGAMSMALTLAGPIIDAVMPPLARIGLIIIGIGVASVFGLLWAASLIREKPTVRNDPDPSWIPLHMAPFKLASSETYGPLYPAWGAGILEAALPGQSDDLSPIMRMRVKDTPLASEIKDVNGWLPHARYEWPLGSFWLGYHEAGQGVWGRRVHVWELGPDNKPEKLDAATWDKVRASFDVVWRYLLLGGMAHLIEKGHVRVWARFGSAQAPFTALNADAWKHFSITDVKAGRASGEGDDRLFSIYIEPLPISASTQQMAKDHPYGEP